jgi:hypothetical protein
LSESNRNGLFDLIGVKELALWPNPIKIQPCFLDQAPLKKSSINWNYWGLSWIGGNR